MIAAPTPEEALSFRQAAAENNIECLQALFNKYGKKILNLKGAQSGKTALHQAVIKNQLEAVNLLIGFGIDINSPDAEGNTALILGYQHQSLKSTHRLLQCNGLDTLHKNLNNMNALMVSLSNGNSKQFSLLYVLFKQRLSEQVLASMGHIPALQIKPNGDIIFLSESKKVEELLKRDPRYNAYGFSENGKVTVLKNEKGFSSLTGDAPVYKVPPLVFLMSHDDPATFELLEKNVHFLLNEGYKALCFEFDDNLDKADVVQIFRTTSSRHECSQDIRAMADLNGLFIESFTNKGFAYHGVDLPLGVLRDELFVSRMTERDLERRNEHIAQQVMKYAATYQGGIIVVLGVGHFGMLKSLVIANHGSHEPFIVYNIRASDDADILNAEDELTNRLLQLKLTEGAGIISVNTSLVTEDEVQTRFFSPILAFLEKNVPTQNYDAEISSSLLLKLQDINKEFRALKREVTEASPFNVDAVLPVATAFAYSTQSNSLKARIPGLELRFGRVKLGSSEPALSLIIEDINGGPNRQHISRI